MNDRSPRRAHSLAILVWAALAMLTVTALSGDASAQTDVYGGGTTSTSADQGPTTTVDDATTTTVDEATTTTVEDTEVEPSVIETSTTLQGAAVVKRAGGSRGGLAVTGGDILGLVAIGGLAIAAGVPLVRASRARRGH